MCPHSIHSQATSEPKSEPKSETEPSETSESQTMVMTQGELTADYTCAHEYTQTQHTLCGGSLEASEFTVLYTLHTKI